MSVGGQRHAPASLPWEKDPLPIVQKGGRAPWPIWVGAENPVPPGFDPRTVRPVASRCFIHRVNSHWHIVPQSDARMVTSPGRWDWWLRLPPKWGSATLPSARLRLPQPAFAPTQDHMNTEYQALLRWPPRSPDITRCDIFLWRYIPPVPQNLPELRRRIDQEILQRI